MCLAFAQLGPFLFISDLCTIFVQRKGYISLFNSPLLLTMNFQNLNIHTVTCVNASLTSLSSHWCPDLSQAVFNDQLQLSCRVDDNLIVMFFFVIHQIFCRHSNLELFKGDACDVESFVSALEGKDAVVSALGVVASIFNPTTFYSESMHAILEGMKR